MKEVLLNTEYPGIFKKSDDSYIVVLDFGRQKYYDAEEGKYRYKHKRERRTANTIDEATSIKKAHVLKRRSEKMTGILSQVTFEEAAAEYIDAVKDRWSLGYRESVRGHVRRIQNYLIFRNMKDKPVRTFSIKDIEEFYQWSMYAQKFDIRIKAENSGKYIKQHMQYDALSHATFTYIASFLKGLNKYMMKDFERFGVEAEIVSLCEIPVPKHHFEPSPLSEYMLIEMIRYALNYELEEYCGSTLTILILGACMGLRKGEILGARWSDIIPGTKNEKNTTRLAVLRQRQKVLGEEFERVPKDGYDDGKTMGERKQRYTSCSDKCLWLLQLVKKEQEKYKTVTEDDYIFQEIKYMKRGL